MTPRSLRRESFLRYWATKRDPPAIQSEAVDDGTGLDQSSVAVELSREFDTMIVKLENRIKKEVRPENKSSRERSARMEAIKGMREKIKGLEEHKSEV
jgi:hypothetical protein